MKNIWTLIGAVGFSFGLMALSSFAGSDFEQAVQGKWIGPCDDGRATGFELSPPLIRVKTLLGFNGSNSEIEFRFFLDSDCLRPALGWIMRGAHEWTELAGNAGTVKGLISSEWYSPLSDLVVASFNDPSPYCSEEPWKLGDIRDVSRCGEMVGLSWGPRVTLLDSDHVSIPAKIHVPDLVLTRIPEAIQPD